MYKRLFDVENKLDEAMFLFGARQTGKSTLLRERFKEAIYYDLLNPRIKRAFKLNPNSLWEALQDKPAKTLVIIDEIQKVPELLDVVHSLMVNRGLFFILSGSSARKIKRSGANTLGGRAIPETLYPLVWPEVTDFQIDRAVQNGMIPRHYMVENAVFVLNSLWITTNKHYFYLDFFAVSIFLCKFAKVFILTDVFKVTKHNLG